MIVNIWGTRGSLPMPDVSTIRYGGNTSCFEVYTKNKHRIIIDAGTGIRALGDQLQAAGNPVECSILLTHTHWDHIQGFPFFVPIYQKGNTITIYYPPNQIRSIKEAFEILLSQSFHPITLTKLKADVKFVEFIPGKAFEIGDAVINSSITQHPALNIAFSINNDGWTVVFTGDHEGGLSNIIDPHCTNLANLFKGADAAIVDAMYADSEYEQKEGWGHSTYTMWVKPAVDLGVRRLFFSHHNMTSTDDVLDATIAKLRQNYMGTPIELHMAKETHQITKKSYNQLAEEAVTIGSNVKVLHTLRKFAEELSEYNDVGMILDRILLEARKATRADAGTFFLVENDKLNFAYVHNDTLFSADTVNKYIYSNSHLDINDSTIAGYVAFHRKTLRIDDVYKITPDKPYTFNSSFDSATGYHSQSVLVAPILSDSRKLLGVIQLLNSKNSVGKIVPFTKDDQEFLEILTVQASAAIVRGLMAREMVLRMLALTTMRDPKETKGHFQRVGAYAAEIFHHWAEKQGMDIDHIKRLKDQISVAAMLHDVGKVGVPDRIMLKPAKLDEEEFMIMTKHTILGASLFENTGSSLDEISRTIAYYHHEKWNGKGYRGEDGGIPLAGTEIPWSARVTAIADVFDALNSKRAYKEKWDFQESVDIIKKDAGSHFDPEMVEAFLEILDTLKAIQERYPD